LDRTGKKGKGKRLYCSSSKRHFRQIEKIDGFISASILKRDLPEGVEFLIITEWESLDAIKQFAGANYSAAVVPALVEEMMIYYDKEVRHYEVNFYNEIKTLQGPVRSSRPHRSLRFGNKS
jgi:heme-degrading monooxygenase HmoA